MSRIAARRRVTRLTVGADPSRRTDFLAVEEPLEIRLGGSSFVVTMRSPGHDVELAAGFLVSEGVIAAADELTTARYCAGATADDGNTYNVLDLQLAPGVAPPDPGLARNFTTTSACGLCGKSSIEDVHTISRFTVASDPLLIDAALLTTFPGALRAQQAVFDRTGGLHAAALFDGRTGELLVVREDVGRHNAVDKVVGWALREGLLPSHGTVLQVSGRASFELVQKTRMAGINVLSAVSAPSSLAVELAESEQVTVAGFSRGSSVNVYTHPERIAIRRNDA